MTPSYFSNTDSTATLFYVYAPGDLNSGQIVTNSIGVRPVINIRSDVLISQGDGTIENPYFLKIS